MPGIENGELFVPTVYQVHRGPSLGHRADEVLAARDVQQGTLDIREVYALPTKFYLSLGELVLLVEVSDPLPKSLAWEGCSIVHPLAALSKHISPFTYIPLAHHTV